MSAEEAERAAKKTSQRHNTFRGLAERCLNTSTSIATKFEEFVFEVFLPCVDFAAGGYRYDVGNGSGKEGGEYDDWTDWEKMDQERAREERENKKKVKREKHAKAAGDARTSLGALGVSRPTKATEEQEQSASSALAASESEEGDNVDRFWDRRSENNVLLGPDGMVYRAEAR